MTSEAERSAIESFVPPSARVMKLVGGSMDKETEIASPSASKVAGKSYKYASAVNFL